MKTYCVQVTYFIPAEDEDELDKVLEDIGATTSEYYGAHDVLGFEEEEEIL